MTQQDDTKTETVKLLDQVGLSSLMQIITDNGYTDSLQLAANLTMLGLIQYRVVSVSEEEILDAIKIQIPLADLVVETVIDGASGRDE